MARVAVTISLSDDERAELEALSRRRKTSHLRGGLGSSWRRRKGWRTRRSPFVSRRARTPWASGVAAMRRIGLDGLYDEPRPGAPRQIGDDAIAEVPADAGRDAAGRDPLEPSLDGVGRCGHAPSDHSSHLAGLRLAAASRRRPSSCRAIPSSWRKVRDIVGLYLAPLGSCPGSLCRRKEPDPGPGPFPAPLADAPRAGGAAQPPTTSATGTTSRKSFAALDIATAERSSANVSRAIGPESSANSSTSCRGRPWWPRHPHRHGQLRDPQDQGDPRSGSPNGRAGRPISTHQRLLAEPGQALRVGLLTDKQIRRRRPSLHQGVGAHHRSTHRHVEPNPNPSNGPNPPMTSSNAIQRFCLRTIEIAEQQAKIMQTSESGH